MAGNHQLPVLSTHDLAVLGRRFLGDGPKLSQAGSPPRVTWNAQGKNRRPVSASEPGPGGSRAKRCLLAGHHLWQGGGEKVHTKDAQPRGYRDILVVLVWPGLYGVVYFWCWGKTWFNNSGAGMGI